MAHKVGIYYDEGSLREIMKGDGIRRAEEEIMSQKLSQIEAEFLNTCGETSHIQESQARQTSKK